MAFWDTLRAKAAQAAGGQDPGGPLSEQLNRTLNQVPERILAKITGKADGSVYRWEGLRVIDNDGNTEDVGGLVGDEDYFPAIERNGNEGVAVGSVVVLEAEFAALFYFFDAPSTFGRGPPVTNVCHYSKNAAEATAATATLDTDDWHILCSVSFTVAKPTKGIAVGSVAFEMGTGAPAGDWWDGKCTLDGADLPGTLSARAVTDPSWAQPASTWLLDLAEGPHTVALLARRRPGGTGTADATNAGTKLAVMTHGVITVEKGNVCRDDPQDCCPGFGSGSGSGAGSGGGSGVDTVTCTGGTFPRRLYVVVENLNGNCPCLDGVVIPADYGDSIDNLGGLPGWQTTPEPYECSSGPTFGAIDLAFSLCVEGGCDGIEALHPADCPTLTRFFNGGIHCGGTFLSFSSISCNRTLISCSLDPILIVVEDTSGALRLTVTETPP